MHINIWVALNTNFMSSLLQMVFFLKYTFSSSIYAMLTLSKMTFPQELFNYG